MHSGNRNSMQGIDARFSSLFLSHYDDVLGYCVRRTNRTEADDVAAEVFTIAWRRIDELDWETVRPWLFGIARGVLANQARSGSRRNRLGLKIGSLARHPVDGPEVVVIRREQDEEIIAVLASLRETDREILMLSVWEGFTAPEMASVLGTTTSAAEQRLHRAKRRFADAFERSPAQISLRAAQEGGER